MNFVETDNANAASRASVRQTAATARKPVVSNTTTETLTTTSVVKPVTTDSIPETTEPEITVANKSNEFGGMISAVLESAASNNSFAEQIRKQRAALAANDATTAVSKAQQNALKTSSNTCDSGLRKCMATKCGNDFTKCALDGDTIFGDKLNACRRDTTCTGEEFALFTTEIKADRDMNVRLGSYDGVINCGNQYNACIINECGTTYNKCLGKAKADAAIQKCATIARECMESDSGLANRFGTAIGKLRENAEKEIKKDEERMYTLRDLMSGACKKLGSMFDERTFDCVYTVNFFAGDNQTTPLASRKRYAGDTFVCMQEWFGVNATTYRENAYRETRAQTGASSAMLGGGVGTAVGLVTSGAIDRALDTQKAKKEYKNEKKLQEKEQKAEENVEKEKQKEEKKSEKDAKKAEEKAEKEKKKECTAQGGTWKGGECIASKGNNTDNSGKENANAGKANNNNTNTDEGQTGQKIEMPDDAKNWQGAGIQSIDTTSGLKNATISGLDKGLEPINITSNPIKQQKNSGNNNKSKGNSNAQSGKNTNSSKTSTKTETSSNNNNANKQKSNGQKTTSGTPAKSDDNVIQKWEDYNPIIIYYEDKGSAAVAKYNGKTYTSSIQKTVAGGMTFSNATRIKELEDGLKKELRKDNITGYKLVKK